MTSSALSFVESVALRRPASATSSFQIETVTDLEGFDALRTEWDELLHESASDSLFLTWEWLRTWWRHLAGPNQLAILTLRRANELVLIAPFMSSGASLLGLKRLAFLGTGRVGSDYLDVIVRRGVEDVAIAQLARYLVALDASVDLRQVRITSSSGSRLARDMRTFGSPVKATRTHCCPVIDLGNISFEAYLDTLGSEHRYAFHRKLRRLETHHKLGLERVVSEQRRLEVLPILFELHRLRWDERGGSDGLSGPGILEFHDDITRLALEEDWLRLFVLWVDEVPAATLYGFRYGATFSFYQSGFDPAYRKLGVGMVTLGLAIKAALAEGVAEFDFLHGTEPYKFHWAKRTRRLGRIRAFPPNGRGRLSYFGASALDAARSVLRRVPVGKPNLAKSEGGAHAAPAR